MTKSWDLIERHLLYFLEDEVKKTGLNRVVVGLSGGLDSAVVAVLLKKVFGENLLAVMMPSQYSSESSLRDARELIDKFSIRSEKVDISQYLEVFNSQNSDATDLRRGNFSARVRMVTLYDISARESALVIGTSNKSEILLGYGTLFGDLASAINPIGDIYKSELFSFAKYLGVPDSIVNKPPSADLYDGQSDENDIGYSYEEIDKIFKMYVEKRMSVSEIIKYGEDEKLVNMLIKRIYQNHFKRKMPVVAKLSNRTFGHDFLYARDIKL
jgi:NAD+ synthase